MEILRTKVFPKVDRNVALAVLQADMAQQRPALFSLVDKKSGSISGCKRLAKSLTSEYCGVHPASQATLSNFSNRYLPLDDRDLEPIVKGLGTRFPCDHGWIMSVQKPKVFLDFFHGESVSVNQNSYLPGTCNVFCFGVFGALALSVRPLIRDDAIAEIESDDPLEPFGAKSWAYIHFSLDDEDRSKVAKMMRSRGAELKKHGQVLANTVKSSGRGGRASAGGEPRVSLSSIAKKHFKKMGYVWNKSESERRVTVFDKVTERGNVIRISADAAGFNEVIPYIDARFLGAWFGSDPILLVSAQGVTTADELQTLLSRHENDLRYYEQHIAAIYDEEMGPCHPTITKLIQDHRIRRIE